MFYALVYYPLIDDPDFHSFRNNWEPYAGLLREHVPFIFPVPDLVNKDKFVSHITGILSHWKPFDIHISGYQKTCDHWIILTLKEGRQKTVKLHDELYSGLLEPYLNRNLAYIPHIGMALVSNEKYDLNDPEAPNTLDERKYKEAMAGLKQLRFDFWKKVDQLIMVEINENFTICNDLMTFSL